MKRQDYETVIFLSDYLHGPCLDSHIHVDIPPRDRK